ncbi:MAG: molybdopterin-dependent oxidoreductase, partial [Caulobacteraceae bacterium]|nr:molybdopterin-dependent oxidoreductase [Caulobacter sp.]
LYPRIAPAPLEPRAAIARFNADGDRFHLWTTCQGVHWVRRVLSDALGIPPERLRVETGDLGGGFGARIFAYPEYALVLWLARRLGRPVRWTSSRTEAFHADTQGRDHRFAAELALDAEGRFLALRIDDRTCLGAYLSQYAPYSQAGCGAPVQAGGYRIGALHVRTRGYFTTMTPVDAFRGTGRPEATYVLERLIDQAARETGRDPAALRAINLRGRTTEPVTLVTGQAIDGGQFLANQEICLERADRAGFPARRKTSAEAGRLRGFGLANYLEANGSLGIARLTTGDAPQEAASIRFDGCGGATIRVGTQSSGQDHATPLRRIAAERLGLDPDAIRVEEGDSDALPLGGGTGGSRSTLAGLHALNEVLALVEEHAGFRCAALWGVAREEVGMEGGVLHARRTNRSLAFADLVHGAPGEFDLTAIARFERGSFANGCHACEVEVDPETGAVCVVAYTAVDDFGTVLDEAEVRGQVQGGVAHGLGTALMEDCAYDPASGRPLAFSFETYALPRAADVPAVAWVDNGLPSPWTPMGVKACGESAISAAPPAIINAVVDALDGLPAAAELQMPATAWEVGRILRAKEER